MHKLETNTQKRRSKRMCSQCDIAVTSPNVLGCSESKHGGQSDGWRRNRPIGSNVLWTDLLRSPSAARTPVMHADRLLPHVVERQTSAARPDENQGNESAYDGNCPDDRRAT